MKKILYKSYSLAWLVFAFFVPMPDKLVSPFLSICMIFMLLFLLWSGLRIHGSRARNQYLLAFLSFSLFSLASLLYSENIEKGLGLFTRRIVILFLPVFLLFTGYHKQKKELLLSFILGNYVFIIYILVFFLISYFSPSQSSQVSDKSLLFKEALKGYKHVSYLGINLSLWLLSIAYFVKESKSVKAQLWLATSTVAGFLIMYLSYSRMGFIVYSFTAFYIYFVVLFLKKRKKAWIIATTVLAVISIIAISNNSRFTSILQSDQAELQSHTDYIGYSHRISIWTRATDLISQHPLLGYGMGDSLDSLDWDYEGRKYNAHNQFLEFLLEGGIVALMLFVIPLLFLAFKRSHQRELWLSVGVVGIFFFGMLTESILNRIAGIASFALFFWVLSGKDNEIERKNFYTPLSGLSYLILLGMLISLGIVLITSSFNPANPRTFVNRISKIVEYKDLPGILPSSLPVSTKGYLFDHHTNASTWDGNAYAYTSFHDFTSDGDELITATVYCYVSEDFNGTWVRLSAEGPDIKNKASFYDMAEKGTWQLLEINPDPVSGDISLMMFISKFDSQSFETLEGFVIFAYPHYEVYGTIPK